MDPPVQIRLARSPGDSYIDSRTSSIVNSDSAALEGDVVVVVRAEDVRRSQLLSHLHGAACSLPMTRDAFELWQRFEKGLDDSKESLQELCDVLEVRCLCCRWPTSCTSCTTTCGTFCPIKSTRMLSTTIVSVATLTAYLCAQLLSGV